MKEYKLLCLACNEEGRVQSVRLRRDDLGINVILKGVCLACSGDLIASAHIEYEQVPQAFFVDDRQGLLFVN